jgi:cyclopropane-fatty-acyl-phospholipid synthase
VGALLGAVARGSDLRLAHSEEHGMHYARTLRLWREAFMGNLERVRAMGFDRRFERTWEYYLAYCEAGYAEGLLGNVQMVFAKPAADRNVVIEPMPACNVEVCDANASRGRGAACKS